jgi:molybdopterin converting factor small subunit
LKVRVRCYTGMRRYAAENSGSFEIELAEGADLQRLLDAMHVPPDIAPFTAVNGRKAGRDHRLRNGDEIVLFTHMEGG